jgi:hypothetical protein
MKAKVPRSIAGSVLSLFVVATFLWGGCVSCEQYFMFPGIPMPAALPATVPASVLQLPAGVMRLTTAEVLVDPSPPDLQAQNATFLI